MSEFSPRTPEEVFKNFKGRQAGINKALNDDVVRARVSEARSFFFFSFSNSRFKIARKLKKVMQKRGLTRARTAIAVQ